MGHPDSIRHPRVSGNLVYVGQAVQHRGSIQFPVLVWANWIHVSESNHILICNFCREFAEIPVPLSIAVSFDVRLTININRPFQLQSEGLGGQNCALPFLIAFYSKTFFFFYQDFCSISTLLTVITVPCSVLPSVSETQFAGGSSPLPPSLYLQGKVSTFYLLPKLVLLSCWLRSFVLTS